MPEIPEHLRKRSEERRKALGLPAEGDSAPQETSAPAQPQEPAPSPEAEPAPVQATSAAITEDKDGVPAHLLERSRKRRAQLSGGDVGAAPAAPAAGGGGTAVIERPPITATGPEGHTHRLLTVVKAGSIQQTRAEAQDKVHVWPHLLAIEFTALLALTAATIIFSAFVRAPLLGLADINQTPNPSKAPWYFLGLQELLTMFDPMVAGVTIPGIGLVLLACAPYIDKNPGQKPNSRKFAICLFTIFLMFWAVLTIIGSFFRGPGFNFVFPWTDGIYFEL